jgi:hypothetical protein
MNHQNPLLVVAWTGLLIGAIVLWRREVSLALLSTLGPLYLQINYLFWFLSTLRFERAIGGVLEPPTLLNNTLYGAQWWHVVYLSLSLIMLVWIVRLILIERRDQALSLSAE